MCLVLTDDTRLARPEQLEEIERVCRRWTCDGSVTQEQTRSSGCATGDPWERHRPCRLCSMVRQKAPKREAARMCVDRCHKSSPGHGAKAIGSGTRIANSRASMPVNAARRQPRADPEVPEEHLQNTDDLVVLQCTARQKRQQRGTVIIGNPVHRAFEKKTTHHVEFSRAPH